MNKLNKLTMHSTNFTEQNIAKLAELFPNCVTETTDADGNTKPAIDWDLLKQELSDNIVEGGRERYRLDWPGKRQALLTANRPIYKTLRPSREESVDFDNTKNLFIEGDNLDALKLLQDTYLGKVKMIYIDPPYNTGKDFIYKDKFQRSATDELKASGQIDADGNRLVANTESNGRFHSDWLSMIYPRLKLARNLLRDDGVIFISIDDNEQANLKRICDEIFGEINFVTNLVWQKKTGASDSISISTITENILVYCKDSTNIQNIFSKNTESYDLTRYRNEDEYKRERGPYYTDNLDRGGLQYSDSLNFGIECPDGTITYPNGRTEFFNDGWIWKWSKKKIEWARKNNFITLKKSDKKKSGWAVYYKNYLLVDNENKPVKRAAPHKNLITSVLNASSAADMKSLFKERVFQYTKPVDLIYEILSLVRLNKGDTVLDFFSGSATTAHSTLKFSSEKNVEINFIQVQLPEATDEKSEAYKAGYKNICEIGKERIRRAGNKIKADNADNKDIAKLDTGFRVLKVDSSNMAGVYYNPNAVEQYRYELLVNNIKDGRTDEDLLFQVLLNWAVDLTLPITVQTIADYQVFFVDGNALAACFAEDKITEDLCTKLAQRQVLRVVFRDSGFKDDSVRINVEQIFKLLSPHTDIKII